MRRWLGILVFLTLVAACRQRPAEPQATARPGLSHGAATGVILGNETFGKPIYLEVWAAGSPTALRLEAMGYLDLAGGKLSMTEQARRLGVRQDFFQTDVPVFRVPVGRREIVGIRSIEELPMSAYSRQVEFSYREQPNEVGRRLLDAGSRLDVLQPTRVRPGRAFFTPTGDGWSIGLIEL